MSEIYFLGTTKPLAHTEYKFKDVIPDMYGDGMLYNDGIRFEENLWPDAVATGVRKILKGCHIYAVQTTLGLDYEVRYKQAYGPQTAADMIKILNWLKDFMAAQINKGSKVYLIKLWQGREILPKEVKKEEIQTNAWSIFGDGDIIFGYGTLYEFTYISPEEAFGRSNMDDVLEKFKDCDSFSLTATWKEGWLLTDEQAEHALSLLEERSKEICCEDYDKFTDEQRAEYPDFEALCEGFRQKYGPIGREWEMLPEGPAKYKSFPRFQGLPEHLRTFWLWAIWGAIDRTHIEMLKLVGATPPEEALTGEYAAIKPYLIRVLPSFFHHCTQGGSFRCHFVFELNEQTWAWIAEYPDTDCFTGLLQDLALYKGDNIVLSCCSHEGLYEEITVPQKCFI